MPSRTLAPASLRKLAATKTGEAISAACIW